MVVRWYPMSSDLDHQPQPRLGTPLTELEHEGAVIVMGLGVRAPDGCPAGAIASAFPHVHVKVLRVFPLGHGLFLEDVRLSGDFSDEVQKTTVMALLQRGLITVLESGKGGMTLRLARDHCPLMEILQKVEIPPSFPLMMEGNTELIQVEAPRDKAQRLIGELKSEKQEFTVRTIWTNCNRSRRGNPTLTARQAEIYRIARSAGYWDTPRRTTMTELAHVLRLSKSSLSETLATVERKIMKEGMNPDVL